MAFILRDLPFDRQALGDHMSAETLDLHHGKHHRAYIDKTNELATEKGLAGASLVQVVRAAFDQAERALFNNSAQAWNHSFFWQCLAPPQGQSPEGKLADLIDQEFGSAQRMLGALEKEATAHFASGWAWLLLDRGRLLVASLHDSDSPVAHDGMTPLLTLDLWEHAYYLDYRNDRGAYAESVLGNIVDWEFVARNLDGEGASRADQPN
jgi:Fe-Mn family superoxide dismutase